MSLHVHCDRDGCDHHQMLSVDNPSTFYALSHGGGIVGHWCSLECVMHWAAAASAETVAAQQYCLSCGRPHGMGECRR